LLLRQLKVLYGPIVTIEPFIAVTNVDTALAFSYHAIIAAYIGLIVM
jgi:hypothetical protein